MRFLIIFVVVYSITLFLTACPPESSNPTPPSTATPPEIIVTPPDPTSTPIPTATPVIVSGPIMPPPIDGVNGCQHPDSKGKCGFTIYFSCPTCKVNRAWPCDQGHTWWTVPPYPTHGNCDDLGDCRTWGSCEHTTQDFPDSDATKMCNLVCKSSANGYGRAWDATCASIGNTFIKVLSGNLKATSGRNCYSATLTGSGTYQVCLKAGARACVDPEDYMGQEDRDIGPFSEKGTCAHGEILLTPKDVCGNVLSY